MVAALASFLDARHHGGRWLVRIDDIDPPREQAGAATAILKTLEAAGLAWDDEVVYQSSQRGRYDEALAVLNENGRMFACACTRKDMAGGIYPGTCRDGIPAGRHPRTQRVRVDDIAVDFNDRIQGPVTQYPAREVGDFVLLRADGFIAYHLACVVDDALAGVTDIVRGVDLLDSTARQITLQRLLGYQTPRYAHLPVVLNEAGKKLSKQTFAEPIAPGQAAAVLFDALVFLEQVPPADLRGAGPDELLAWAIAGWRIDALIGRASSGR